MDIAKIMWVVTMNFSVVSSVLIFSITNVLKSYKEEILSNLKVKNGFVQDVPTAIHVEEWQFEKDSLQLSLQKLQLRFFKVLLIQRICLWLMKISCQLSSFYAKNIFVSYVKIS